MPSKKNKSSAANKSSPTGGGGAGTRLSSLSGKKASDDEQAVIGADADAAKAVIDRSRRSSKLSEPWTADMTDTTNGDTYDGGGREPFAGSTSRGTAAKRRGESEGNGNGSSSNSNISNGANPPMKMSSSAKSAATDVTRQRDNLSGHLSNRSSFASVGSGGAIKNASASASHSASHSRAVSVSSSEADAERAEMRVLSATRLATAAAAGHNTSSYRRQKAKKAASEAGSIPSSAGSGSGSGSGSSSAHTRNNSMASHRTGTSMRSKASHRYVLESASLESSNYDRDLDFQAGATGSDSARPKRLGARGSLGSSSTDLVDNNNNDRSVRSITESARDGMSGAAKQRSLSSMAISKLNISADQLIGRADEQKRLLDAFARTQGKDGATSSQSAPTNTRTRGMRYGSILEHDNEDEDADGDDDNTSGNISGPAPRDGVGVGVGGDFDFADADVTESYPEIAMVSGRSGAGKTVFVRNTLRGHQNLFLEGKFDLHARSARPYAAFCDAFADLAPQIMDLPESSKVQKALMDALGEDGAAVICDLIPSLEDILEPIRREGAGGGVVGSGGLDDNSDHSIMSSALMAVGTDPKSSIISVESGPEELNRLQYMLRKMIDAVGTPERPVVLFLDDLQWADDPTLALLVNLATNASNGSTLIVGTYRSNEVDDEHDLIAALKDIKERRNNGITDISLGNLSHDDCLLLVAEALRSTTEATKELGEVVYEKTNGNAFFVTAFLQALDEEELITFNLGTFKWSWDKSAIARKHVSENVSDLMKLRLLDLSEEDQKVLQVASCLGCEFDQKTLALAATKATGILDVDLGSSLWNAVEGGVLRSVDNESLYAFVHDQIQFAAFDAIPESERNAFQGAVGAAILSNADSEALQGDLLLIAVDLCNCDSSQMKARSLLAELNLKAGQAAVKSAAFSISASYFEAGLNLLDEEMYMLNMPLVIDLHTLFAQSLYCQGNFDRCMEVLEDLLAQSVTVEEKLPAYFIKLTILFVTNRHAEGMPLTQQVFKELGFSLFPKKTNMAHIIKDLIKTKAIVKKHKGSITNLPLCTDQSRKIAMGLLDIMVGITYILNDPALSLVVFKILRWSIKHGLCAHSGTGLVMFGVITCGLGDLKGGFEFGEIATAVHKRLKKYDIHTKRMYIVEGMINHYQLPLQPRAKQCLDICEVSMRNGDNEGAMWALFHNACYSWFCGMDLRRLEDKIMKPHLKTIFEYKIVISGTMLLPFRQAAINLMGESEDPLILTGEAMDEKELLAEADAEGNLMCKNCVISVRMELAYQFHDYKKALEAADILDPPEQSYPSFFQGIRQKMFEGLTCFALAREGGPNAKSLKKRGNVIVKRIAKLVKGGDVNCVHYLHLLGAEQSFTNGKSSNAKADFDRAISTSSRNGFTQDRALSHERCALFFVNEKDNEWARHHMTKAIESYEDWGASQKVQFLKETYANLLS